MPGGAWKSSRERLMMPYSRIVIGTPAVNTSGGGDCDDWSTTVYPGATEVCNNGIDHDCAFKGLE